MAVDGSDIPAEIPSRSLRLGDFLLQAGLIKDEDLRKALVVQRARGRFLGEVLVEMGVVSADEIRRILSDRLRVPAIDLGSLYGDPSVIERIPKAKAFELNVIPLFEVGGQLTVAMSDPNNLARLDELRFLVGMEILPVLALDHEIRSHLAVYYGEIDSDAGEEAIEFESPAGQRIDPFDVLEQVAGDRPIIRLVNLVIARALQEEASDIHLEPQLEQMNVRYRIDGRLHPKPYAIPSSAAPAIVSRIKVLAQCDISERRVPQDGKVSVRFRGRLIDVRVSTFPTIHGEKVVLRLLDKERTGFELGTLGMSPGNLQSWRDLVRAREGLLLVTGPTGSGKSSTLFATLKHLSSPEVNLVTLEDPVEYVLLGASQGQVNPRGGFTFASGLRAILRQDPDIILVGEVRDLETAQIAIHAALTGHLVLATLHTNDAPSAVTRLVDMGVPRYLVASSVIGVLAQRLIRRLCPACAAEVEPTTDERRLLGPWLADGIRFQDGAGCDRCLGMGYRGRIGVHEIMPVDRDVRRVITAGGTEEEMTPPESGFRGMWFDGVEKARSGDTSLRELIRVLTVPKPV